MPRDVLKATAIGGAAAAALVWLPSSALLVREALGHPIGWGWMVVLPYWLVSPLIVWVGMGAGKYMGRSPRRAG